jgi:hypothetical protein
MTPLDRALISKYRRFCSDDPFKLEIALAATAIRQLLSDDWFEKHLSIKTGYNPFFANARDESGYERYQYQSRIVQLGDLLFDLHQAGLGKWSKLKFSGLKPAAAFAEMYFIVNALRDGQKVIVPKDIHSPGGDFILQTRTTSVPVEVSLYKPETISRSNFIQKLKRKTDQLCGNPGLVFLYVPLGRLNFVEAAEPTLINASTQIWSERSNLMGFTLAWDFLLEQEGAAVGQAFLWFPNPAWDTSEVQPNTDLPTIDGFIRRAEKTPLCGSPRSRSTVLGYVQAVLV